MTCESIPSHQVVGCRTQLNNNAAAAGLIPAFSNGNLERIQSAVLNSICRTKCDDLYARFDPDFTEQSVVTLFGPWPQRKRIFSFPVDRDTA